MRDLRLSMVSFRSAVGDIRGNLEAMLRICDSLHSEGADIVCFPELSLTGYAMPESTRHPASADGPEVAELIDKSSETGMCICFGFLDPDRRITHAVAEDGKLIGTYSKTHLGEREAECVVPGDSLPVFRTSCAVLGIQLCWESHFPEITSTYALQGADIVLMPHASTLGGERRRSIWSRTLPARAYDNTVYVGACNMEGDNGMGTSYGGCASILDPRGFMMADDYGGGCIVSADLTSEPLDRIRAEGYETMRDLYFLDKRRPDLYL